MVKSGQIIATEFHTSHPATGETGSADTLPECALVIDGEDDATPVVVTAKVQDGFYKAEVTLPELLSGQLVQIRGSATVDGVTGTDIVFSDIADTVSLYDIWLAARTLQIANSSGGSDSAGSHTRTRGDRWSVSIEDMGSLAGRTALWFTLKRQDSDRDEDSILQVTELGGLLVVNRAETNSPATSWDTASASITVDDEDNGDVTIEVDGLVTALLKPHEYLYDIQVLLSPSGPDTIDHGTFTVEPDITRATES